MSSVVKGLTERKGKEKQLSKATNKGAGEHHKHYTSTYSLTIPTLFSSPEKGGGGGRSKNKLEIGALAKEMLPHGKNETTKRKHKRVQEVYK